MVSSVPPWVGLLAGAVAVCAQTLGTKAASIATRSDLDAVLSCLMVCILDFGALSLLGKTRVLGGKWAMQWQPDSLRAKNRELNAVSPLYFVISRLVIAVEAFLYITGRLYILSGSGGTRASIAPVRRKIPHDQCDCAADEEQMRKHIGHE